MTLQTSVLTCDANLKFFLSQITLRCNKQITCKKYLNKPAFLLNPLKATDEMMNSVINAN